MKRLAFVVVCVAALGCEEKKEHVAPAPSNAPAVQQPGVPQQAEPAKPGAGAPAQQPAMGDAGAAMQGAANALGAAMKAASEGAKGDTPCEQAYNGMEAMVKSLEKNMPPGGKASANMPPREKFMAACKELPEPMQKCMVMSYAMANQKECMEARQKLDPATAAKVKSLMGK